MSEGQFNDHIVMVTGATTGISRVIALAFVQQGARIIIGEVDVRDEDRVVTITAAGGYACFVETDVSQAT
ncbi:SDR family NAD(P)-dependent oxidoreductase [Pleomorphomonas sp. NRK KF1]|uniref:SDR family NAD(P)-dependent oxidoreductase n=1 Tax=Pleomorphomonas sp. NRK KF1 TaxID=2943000 RepID=UPI00204327C1|nr:SDR family NAD(P)-dependent oxidoreductase [Pleomorphomonas sp. NRK KF1]MCM5551827.1 SDR family NAD(P)-dependent oxidoreductase [Pleomorphomonas sp. NRK KF1]